MGRRITVEPISICLEFASNVGQLFAQPVGVPATDVGEIGRWIWPSVRPDAQPSRVRFDKDLIAGGYLHRPDVNNGLATRGMAAIHERVKVLFSFRNSLGRVQTGGWSDNFPTPQCIECNDFVTLLDELLCHRQTAWQMTNSAMCSYPRWNG